MHTFTEIKYQGPFKIDHFPIGQFCLNSKSWCSSKLYVIIYRNFKKCDYECLREDLENAIWPSVKLININEAVESFTSTFTLIINKHFAQTMKCVKRIQQPGG